MADGGLCGENLTWKLDDKGTLTISGTGAMYDYFPVFIFRMPIWRSQHSSSIKNVVIKHDVISIGDWAFYACMNLTTVTISASVISIGQGAFGWCGSLKGIKIPANVTSIGERAFDECKNLQKIYYPAGRGFEEKLSAGNKAQLIPYTVTLPANERKFFPVVEPAPEKLRWKVEGKKLTVGGVREIQFYRYGELPWVDSVDAIQKIVIEEGVEKISAEAFSECTHLELLTIPASVKTIGDFAFKFCYCGNRDVNGGKNVIWSLDDGVLTFKKNPAVRNASDCSIGVVSWRAVDKNISGVKLERDVIPDKKFFDWRKSLSRDVPVSM